MSKKLLTTIEFDSKIVKSETTYDGLSSIGSQRKKYITFDQDISVSTANTFNHLQFESIKPDEISFIVNNFSANTTLNITTETFEGSHFYTDITIPFFISAGGNTSLYEPIDPNLTSGFYSTVIEGRYEYPSTDYICLDEIQFNILDTQNYNISVGESVTLNIVPFWS